MWPLILLNCSSEQRPKRFSLLYLPLHTTHPNWIEERLRRSKLARCLAKQQLPVADVNPPGRDQVKMTARGEDLKRRLRYDHLDPGGHQLYLLLLYTVIRDPSTGYKGCVRKWVLQQEL